MKVSIVTISYNQAQFLEEALLSVIEQDYSNLEYIVVDPGSTDGSREIIKRHEDHIDKLIFEPDKGPADGLNNGFAAATGSIMGYLNSDDFLLPEAVRTVVAHFQDSPHSDVVSGHALIVNEQGSVIRKTYSDVFSLRRCAYGVCNLIQPSTFFRRKAFELAGGFNRQNHSNWDADLFVEMGLHGARFSLMDAILSGYRVHKNSITGSKHMDDEIREYHAARFARIMGRERTWYDLLAFSFHRFCRYLTNPRDVYERMMHGPIYGRGG